VGSDIGNEVSEDDRDNVGRDAEDDVLDFPDVAYPELNV